MTIKCVLLMQNNVSCTRDMTVIHYCLKLMRLKPVKTYGIIINQVQFFLLFRVSGQSIMYAALVNIVILTI